MAAALGVPRIPIRKLLVANRGEIACRIFRTCRKLGIRTVAVYSEADAHAPHVQAADESLCIGPAAALESYLNIPVLIETAKRIGADAIHPGYGFLSENPAFVHAVEEAGLNFVGPKAKTMEDLGNKKASKDLLGGAASDVPLVPGYNGDDQTIQTLKSEIARIGCPVLIKAAAGGGGKGMRVVNNLEEAEDALNSVKLEGKNSFNNDQVLLEAYLQNCRHIEFQIFGDNYGNVIHLGERDCSVQRRHQKVIEETPSPYVSADLRARMGRTAVRIGELVNYRNAGTVEFLVDQKGRYYFLEVNTRLQVEHPVTEIVNNLDLVELQLEIAQGFNLKELGLMGGPRVLPPDTPKASIECRLYAEDPSKDFFPCTGPLLVFKPKDVPGVRYDSGVQSGSVVSVYYDPMITKIIASGPSRRIAIDRMIAALQGTVVLGLVTNKSFILSMLKNKAFYEGNYDTTFIPRFFTAAIRESLTSVSQKQATELAVVATLYDWMRRRSQQPNLRHIASGFSNTRRTFRSSSFVLSSAKDSPRVEVQYQYDSSPVSSFTQGAGTPLGRARPHSFNVRTVITTADGKETIESTQKPFRVALLDADLRTGELSAEIDGVRRHYHAAINGDMPLQGIGRRRAVHDDEEGDLFVHSDEVGGHTLHRLSRFGTSGDGAGGQGGLVKAQQTCKILSVEVSSGAAVKKKQVIMVSESMKMVTKLIAEVDGTVEVFAKAGQVVDGGAKLYSITPAEAQN